MNSRALDVRVVASAELTPATRAHVHALCNAAYDEDTAPFFADVGAGTHVLGVVDGVLVAHAMWVTRALETSNGLALTAAYVELVATHPTQQRRGHASELLRRLVDELPLFDLAALSPSD
ncbi:MAG: GNAT family N-acetyltransferase, partial [Gemmatimonadaceae bacterium]|nr:GNAT family N-acetyltransferase [Gemmatimonadaceae bacterium]